MAKLSTVLVGVVLMVLQHTSQSMRMNQQDTFSNCISAVSSRRCAFYRFLSRFRSVDGTCNNLRRGIQGAANTPLGRLLSPLYADVNNRGTPRGFPGTPSVPTPHEVSAAVFSVHTQNIQRSRGLSAMFMAFGQFVDHDFGYTTHPTCQLPANRCASMTAFTYPCFPIRFQRNGKSCTPFARSFPVCPRRNRRRATRQQINIISSYLDLSQVYSNDLQVHRQLRQLDGSGLLKVTNTNLLPIKLPETDARCDIPGGCSLVGDDRGDENIVLHTLHTIFARNHNYIAKQLKKARRYWNENFLFETARKINIAIYQRIIYTEFLPNLIDVSSYQRYKPSVDASLFNVFSTAAFRFGHSLVPNAWSQLDKNFNRAFDDISLQASFEDTRIIRQRGIESTTFGLLANQSQQVDASFAFGLARRLFVPIGETTHEDLTALNIQRGRDHGLPTYGAWRRICNLRSVSSFSDLAGTFTSRVVSNFQKVYTDPNDIDIFAAGIAETPTNGKMLGPTFQCIQRIQFERLRDGDRFWYEKPYYFTRPQLDEINKMTLAKVLCNTLADIVSIQPKALQAVTRRTRRKECSSLPGMNFAVWRFNY